MRQGEKKRDEKGKKGKEEKKEGKRMRVGSSVEEN